MARYLLLLHRENVDFSALGDAERAANFERFVKWTESLKARGVLGAVERLAPDGGTTVRRQRDAVVVDGPYAEMRELISGLYVIEAPDRDAANAIAAECPHVAFGGAVEVRAIDTFPVKP
jgi:hypothetical protein